MKANQFVRRFPMTRYSIKDLDPHGTERSRIYFAHVLQRLWETDCEDVQEVCFTALEEAPFPQNSFESFLSEVPHLAENHARAQNTIVALVVDGKGKLASKVARVYLDHAIKAVEKDHYNHSSALGDQDLPSEKFLRLAVRLVLDLFLCPRPKVLSREDRNSLFLRSELTKFLLDAVELQQLGEWYAKLFLRVYSARRLHILSNEGVIREESWLPYEKLFEHVLLTDAEYFDAVGFGYVAKMAELLQSMEYEGHEVLGSVLAQRAKHVCGLVLVRWRSWSR